MRLSVLFRTGFLASACLVASAVYAAGAMLKAPEQLELDGQVYQLGGRQNLPQQLSWQYTTGGEKAAGWNWTRLLTLNQINIGKASLETWAQATETNFNRQKPQPWSHFETRPDQAWVQVIFPPDASHPTYESHAWHGQMVPGCGGLLVVQFSRQIAAAASAVGAAVPAEVQQQNDADMAALKKLAWQADCPRSARPATKPEASAASAAVE